MRQVDKRICPVFSSPHTCHSNLTSLLTTPFSFVHSDNPLPTFSHSLPFPSFYHILYLLSLSFPFCPSIFLFSLPFILLIFLYPPLSIFPSFLCLTPSSPIFSFPFFSLPSSPLPSLFLSLPCLLRSCFCCFPLPSLFFLFPFCPHLFLPFPFFLPLSPTFPHFFLSSFLFFYSLPLLSPSFSSPSISLLVAFLSSRLHSFTHSPSPPSLLPAFPSHPFFTHGLPSLPLTSIRSFLFLSPFVLPPFIPLPFSIDIIFFNSHI